MWFIVLLIKSGCLGKLIIVMQTLYAKKNTYTKAVILKMRGWLHWYDADQAVQRIATITITMKALRYVSIKYTKTMKLFDQVDQCGVK